MGDVQLEWVAARFMTHMNACISESELELVN